MGFSTVCGGEGGSVPLTLTLFRGHCICVILSVWEFVIEEIGNVYSIVNSVLSRNLPLPYRHMSKSWASVIMLRSWERDHLVFHHPSTCGCWPRALSIYMPLQPCMSLYCLRGQNLEESTKITILQLPEAAT